MATRQIAALYVETDGIYYGLDSVDPWDSSRDARLYEGPYPIVAHPPCERWGFFWSGGPKAHAVGRPRKLGDDGGCFRAAVAAVRKFGGVIEHPRGSKAWEVYGIRHPKKRGGWMVADNVGGFSCYVEQGAYGHRARKATWLYVCGIPREDLPELMWVSDKVHMWIGGDGYKSNEERQAAREMGFVGQGKYMPRRERAATPEPFRDLLIDIARRVKT